MLIVLQSFHKLPGDFIPFGCFPSKKFENITDQSKMNRSTLNILKTIGKNLGANSSSLPLIYSVGLKLNSGSGPDSYN